MGSNAPKAFFLPSVRCLKGIAQHFLDKDLDQKFHGEYEARVGRYLGRAGETSPGTRHFKTTLRWK